MIEFRRVDLSCPHCGAWVWQYEPGGRWWERTAEQKDQPHTCKRPTTKDRS